MQDRHTGNEQLDLEYATLQHTVSVYRWSLDPPVNLPKQTIELPGKLDLA